MSIKEIPVSSGVAKRDEGYDISDLNLDSLFLEPPSVGVFERFLPWINSGLLVILLLVQIALLIFK